MVNAFGTRLRELRTARKILQATFAEKCQISAAYLSDIERGRRNPPSDKVILEWAAHLDAGDAEEIGQELIALAARDQGRAEAVTENVVEEAGTLWESVLPAGRGKSTRGREGGGGKKSRTPFLDHFQVDLLELARQSRLDPAPGRGREFRAIAGVLSRRRRNSPLLTAESGADLYQVIQGLAQAMVLGQAPEPLVGKRLLRIDGLQAGVKYRGQLEERVKALITETALVGDALLYFHSLGDVVELEKSMNGSLLRPALEDGVVQVITGALPGELDHCRRLNPGLVDCFASVPINPLDRDSVLKGLYELRERYGAHHGVAYADAALVAIVDAAEEGEETGFWQRGLDLLDEVGAQVHLDGERDEVTVADVDSALVVPG